MLALLAGKLAGVGIAALLAAPHSAGFSLTITPAHLNMRPNTYATMTIQNNGTLPLSVTMEAAELVKQARNPGKWAPAKGDVPYIRVSPESFSLSPNGGAKRVRVTVLPSAAPWERNVAVLAVASAATNDGAAQLKVAAGARVIVAGKPLAAAAPASHEATPWWLWPGLGLLVALAMLTLYYAARAGRRLATRR